MPVATPADSTVKDIFNTDAQSLLLQVIINTQRFHEIVRAEKLGDGRLVLPEDVWKAMRLHTPKERIPMSENRIGYALESIISARYTLDIPNMIVTITAPADAFESAMLHPSLTDIPEPKPAPPGFYLNYDISASHTQQTSPYGMLIEGIGFNGWGSAVAGLVARGSDSNHEVLRTETYWQKDLPGKMETLVVGDAITSAGAWSRPARYAGIRWARDFSLQPGIITFPVPTITGSAALPSVVDLLINNQRTQSTVVNPGPFQLNNVPVVTGAGEVNLVVRDALGVEKLITQRYYASPRLLSPGLNDFSFEVGALRENFLVQSNDYGSGFVAGSLRHGIHHTLTGEGRIELQESRQAAGVELAGLLGDIAIGRMAVAHSNTEQHNGNRYVVGVERNAPGIGGSVQWESMDRGYSQFAETGNETHPRERVTAGFGLRALDNATIGFNYIDQKEWANDRLQLFSLNLGISMPNNIYLSAYASQRLKHNEGWSGGLSLIVPLGNQRAVTAAARRDTTGSMISTAEVSQSTPYGPGVGWRLRASDAPSQHVQAGATVNTNYGRFTAEANEGENNNAVRLGASGSLGWLGGLPFATRDIGHGSFAVVSVGDLAGVPVYRSHQLAATTNEQGFALVPSLLPYQKNQITIDPIDLPLDVDIKSVSETTIPFARSGVMVEFPIQRSRNALIILKRPTGEFIPEGARVRVMSSREQYFVAKRGEVYLKNLTNENQIIANWNGGECHLTLDLKNTEETEPRIGPLICADQ